MSTINPEVTGRRVLGTKKGPDSEHARNQMRRRRQESQTMSVPQAGAHYFGLGKNASYEAAERGEIPTVRVGKLLRVPVRLMERIMNEAGKKEEEEVA